MAHFHIQINMVAILIVIVVILIFFLLVNLFKHRTFKFDKECSPSRPERFKVRTANDERMEVGCGHCENKSKNSSSTSSSSSGSSSSDSSCPDCKKHGIGSTCRINTDCACGLSCVSGRCECAKPPPVAQVLLSYSAGFLTITFPPVPTADYYNIILLDNTAGGVAVLNSFFNENTNVTIAVIPGHTYTGYVFSGSDDCGTSETFTISDPLVTPAIIF